MPQLLVATRKGLFTLNESPSGWRITATSFLAAPVTNVLHDARDGALYAALNHGHFGNKLHRSYDQGATWAEIAVPAYPEKPADQPDAVTMSGKVIPWKLVLLWELVAGGAGQPGVLWAGTLPGGLFRSDDRGDSWELVRSLWDKPERTQWFGGGYDEPGIHSVCVDPRNSDHLTVGISCGGVWQSRDGGASWECRSKGMFAEYMPPERREDPIVQDPHRIVQCPGQPDFFWTQHHNGVFRSTDNCASWQHVPDVPPSGFGFGVAVHPQDGNRAWTVPAEKDESRIPVDGKVVVAHTRDGGASWTAQRAGLPQEHAYDLTYRHALAIDKSGAKLAFGTTTGSLFTTSDHGSTWQAVTTHLPPVYAVHFLE